MSQTAAIRPVNKATRTVFPQTSAHRALYGLPKEIEVGQHDAAPALTAVRLWGNYPPPASASLRCKFGVEDIGIPSQVECSWGHHAQYARGKGGYLSGGTVKG
ncbi:MAG: hypothetical protein ABIJ00_00885 [Candidatus Eisenbacteria bacterium]